jgi:hypothetical protein
MDDGEYDRVGTDRDAERVSISSSVSDPEKE